MTTMIDVNVGELSGKALDWAVAKAIELPVFIDHSGWVRELPDNSC